MKLWPETLFGRTALIIGLSILIAQFTFLFLARLSFSHLRVQQFAALMADEARTIRAADSLLPGPKRALFAAKLTTLGVIEKAPGPLSRPAGPFGHALEHKLRTLGVPARLTIHGDHLHVAIAEPGMGLHLRLPGALPLLPWPRIGFLIVGAFLAGSGALLIVRRVNRPLADLARAAGIFGRGDTPPPLVGKGPREIQRVSSAFNQMIEDAHRYERDRALLLAGVSHDLRTPLARMRLAVDLAFPEDHELRLGMVQDIEEMDDILTEFLAYARHGVEEAPVMGRLETLIEEIVLRYNRQDRRVLYNTEPLPSLAYRPLATARLITNLIENAVGHGRPPVHVHTAVEGRFVRLSVSDEGPGLTEAQLANLRSGIEWHQDGRRGLGLAIARRIVETHGGTLLLRNRPSGGCEALIRLPLPESGL